MIIYKIFKKFPHDLSHGKVREAVEMMLDGMSAALARNDRIEIRGFGSFYISNLRGRIGRNPKTGVPVLVTAKSVPRFKAGKPLSDRLNTSESSKSKIRKIQRGRHQSFG